MTPGVAAGGVEGEFLPLEKGVEPGKCNLSPSHKEKCNCVLLHFPQIWFFALLQHFEGRGTACMKCIWVVSVKNCCQIEHSITWKHQK